MTKKPSYRFADYTEPWEQRKLGDVGETYTGLSGKTKEDFGHGEGKFITYVNVFNNPLTDLYGLDSVEIDDKQRRVQYGDVLFTTSSETPEDVGLSSVWLGREDNVYLNSFCFGYRPKKDIFDLYYLAFVLRSFSVRREFMLLAQGISRFNISKTKVMDMSINVPSLPEQTAIGSFFQDIDKLISLQQRKLEVLKEQKKTYLKLLFPAKGQTKPSLRFAGFEDDWKEVKLGEVTERITRKNKHLESTLPLTISAQYGLVDQETFFNKKVASKDVSGYYLLKRGEFAYNKSYSSDYPWGAVKRLDNYEKGVLSPLYIVFKPKFIDSDFLAVYYASSNWHKEVSMRATEGARNHGLLNISPQGFFDTELIVPISSAEQEAIGSFFQDLDKAIAKLEEKVNQLKESKQTLLRKMFI